MLLLQSLSPDILLDLKYIMAASITILIDKRLKLLCMIHLRKYYNTLEKLFAYG